MGLLGPKKSPAAQLFPSPWCGDDSVSRSCGKTRKGGRSKSTWQGEEVCWYSDLGFQQFLQLWWEFSIEKMQHYGPPCSIY